MANSSLNIFILVNDYINWRLTQEGYTWEGCPSLPEHDNGRGLFRRMVYKLEQENATEIGEMLASLDLTAETAYPKFLAIANEMFTDSDGAFDEKNLSWGKILAFFAWCGMMAVYCMTEQMPHMIENVCEWILVYCEIGLTEWMWKNNDKMRKLRQYSLSTSGLMSFFFLASSFSIITICIVGVIGNGLSAIVFLQPHFRKLSINILLAAMSVSDLLLLALAIPTFFSGPLASFFDSFSFFGHLFTFCTVYVYPVSMMLNCCSVWLLIGVTFERYLAVCKPFLVRVYCTRKRAILFVILIVTVAILYNFVRFWEFQLGENDRPVLLLRHFKVYLLWYGTVGHLLFAYILPLGTIIYFNVRIGIQLSRYRQSRQRMNTQGRANQRTGKMLVFIVIVFFSCHTPSLIMNLLEAVDQEIFQNSTGLIISDLNNQLVMLNSATTFLFYLRFSTRYRLCAQLLCFGGGRRREDREREVIELLPRRRSSRSTGITTSPQRARNISRSTRALGLPRSSINETTRPKISLQQYETKDKSNTESIQMKVGRTRSLTVVQKPQFNHTKKLYDENSLL